MADADGEEKTRLINNCAKKPIEGFIFKRKPNKCGGYKKREVMAKNQTPLSCENFLPQQSVIFPTIKSGGRKRRIIKTPAIGINNEDFQLRSYTLGLLLKVK